MIKIGISYLEELVTKIKILERKKDITKKEAEELKKLRKEFAETITRM
jgi:hypothetical protein